LDPKYFDDAHFALEAPLLGLPDALERSALEDA
jgi:hypothetical protein